MPRGGISRKQPASGFRKALLNKRIIETDKHSGRFKLVQNMDG